jgi:hypothetical protein
MPPNSLKSPSVGLRTKHQKKKKVRACPLIRNISGIRRHVGALGWD